MFITLFAVTLNAQCVSTIAGSTQGFADGTGTSAMFYNPFGVAVDASGNVYVADTYNHKIRKITSSGLVSTFAGSTAGFADGTGTAAQFYAPWGVAVDVSGNVYVADAVNGAIRKISPSGLVSTIAGGFSGPHGIAVDTSGNVYVADTNNNIIKKITPSGVVSTLAGSTVGYLDGIGTSAKFNMPYGIAVDKSGNVYVTDQKNYKIRKITPSGVVSTLAGSTAGGANGTGTAAQFVDIMGVAVDSSGDLYVGDFFKISDNNSFWYCH